jgi:hypothetical protein
VSPPGSSPGSADPSGSPDAIGAKLSAEVDLVPWPELKSHALADRLFVVAEVLDLVEVAVAVATDAAARVEGWIASAQLKRPGRQQLEAWDADDRTAFRCVIVQPFVLVQRAVGPDAPDAPTGG